MRTPHDKAKCDYYSWTQRQYTIDRTGKYAKKQAQKWLIFMLSSKLRESAMMVYLIESVSIFEEFIEENIELLTDTTV